LIMWWARWRSISLWWLMSWSRWLRRRSWRHRSGGSISKTSLLRKSQKSIKHLRWSTVKIKAMLKMLKTWGTRLGLKWKWLSKTWLTKLTSLRWWNLVLTLTTRFNWQSIATNPKSTRWSKTVLDKWTFSLVKRLKRSSKNWSYSRIKSRPWSRTVCKAYCTKWLTRIKRKTLYLKAGVSSTLSTLKPNYSTRSTSWCRSSMGLGIWCRSKVRQSLSRKNLRLTSLRWSEIRANGKRLWKTGLLVCYSSRSEISKSYWLLSTMTSSYRLWQAKLTSLTQSRSSSICSKGSWTIVKWLSKLKSKEFMVPTLIARKTMMSLQTGA
jgi:hypothetical protein